MSSGSTRRAFLASAASSAAWLAGCAGGGRSAASRSVTPAPVPSDAPTPSPPEPPTAEAIDFWVEVLEAFDEAGPARLGISFRNASERPLTALGGAPHVVPFVDDDYAGEHAFDHVRLLFLPDDSGLRLAPTAGPPDRIEAYLPAAPTEGCWLVPFDWPSAWDRGPGRLYAATLEPGEVRRHPSTLYFTGDCLPGTYRFAGTVDVTVGDPPSSSDLRRATLRFKLLVTPAMNVHVDVQPPVVRTPSDPR